MKVPLVFIILIVALTSIALTAAVTGNNNALADNPSSCINLYDSVITSFKINIGSRIIDPIANPHTNFAAKLGQGYAVTFTLHTASISTSGSTNVGSIWYGSTAYGFASDHCVNGANASSDITITLHNVFMGQTTRGTVQSVEWYTWPLTGPHVTYTVHWY
jgi:hypothetical protein